MPRMKKQRWAVRIVTDSENSHDQSLTGNPMIECLRRMGHVRIHRDDQTGMCFDILAPAGIVDTQEWAKGNADRMRTFLINAVAAPEMP